ncbi:MAG: substrate-binding domain-containing protein [Ilumatobacteraceae bacterium]
MKLRRKFATAAALAALASIVPVSSAIAGTSLGGGGASFLANMMDICAAQYNRNTQFNTNSDTVTYASVGSGTGKTNFANGTYKFGGSESAYSSGAPANLVYIPLVGGPIAIGYRVDGMSPATAQVRLTGELVAKIFAGQITNWNDPAIAAVNKATSVKKKLSAKKVGITASVKKVGTKVKFTVKMTAAARAKYKKSKITITRTALGGSPKIVLSGAPKATFTRSIAYAKNTIYTVKAGRTTIGILAVENVKDGVTITFPNLAIRVAYRSGGSGTTNNFINYLNKTFPTIWTKVTNDNFGTAFPTSVPSDGSFQSASGNEGVSNYVRDNNGAITYAELSYLEERNVKAAAVMNPGKKYVAPSPVSSAIWFEAAEVSADGLVTQNFTNTAADAYPINAISYGLSSKTTSADNTAVKSFFNYFLTQCAPKNAAGAGYTALQGAILAKAQAQVAKISAG